MSALDGKSIDVFKNSSFNSADRCVPQLSPIELQLEFPSTRPSTTPNQCPYQVSTFYTLWNPRNSPDKILKLVVTMTRSKVKSRSQNDIAHLQQITNIPTKYQLPKPYCFQHMAQTRFYRSRSLRQGQRLNKICRSDHDVAHLHPLTNVPTKYQLPTSYGFRDIARTRFSNSRSLRQGQRSHQGHTMTLHTYIS